MMAPVPERAQSERRKQECGAHPDHAKGHAGGEPVLHDQCDQASNHQQFSQAAEPVTAMALMAPMVMIMEVSVVMAAMAAFGMAVILRTAFVQREFVAYANIQFAHLVFLVCMVPNGSMRMISS
jgi:hypothetical protein